MLNFFRRYQKFFFIVVTFFIVVSFCFFGTSAAISGGEKVSNKEIGQLLDGSALKEQKLYGLVRLLQNGAEEGGHTFNLLSDSMVHRDLIRSGLGQMLAMHHFEKLKPELEMRWKRVKNFAPYVHPYHPSISAKNIWSQFAPKIIALLDQLKSAPAEFSAEQLPLLFELYNAQAEFPSTVLHQMLYYRQGKGDQIRHDPGLPQANVALFGFQSINDWFGEIFAEEVGKLILNGACIAREEGYKVTKEEAQTDLFSNVYQGLKTYSEKTPTSEETQKYFNHQMRSLGLNEDRATALWREVLYFKRLFNEVGNAVFMDSLTFNQFKNFANPSHEICCYSLPQILKFENFREMLKFQRYLEIVTLGAPFDLPDTFRSSEEIMDSYPELVYKDFEVEIASTTKLDAAARLSLKETWQWESDQENFAKLQSEFPRLVGSHAKDVETRMQALDHLDETTRFKVDQYARVALINEHPEKIADALLENSREKTHLKVSLKQGETPFSGEKFLALLEIEDPSLAHYTEDNETFYSIKVLEKGRGWNLFTFAQAEQEQKMDRLLDELLLTAYPSLKLKDPFEQVKDIVGAKIYADLLKSIAKYAKIEKLDDYATHRFDAYLERMRSLATSDKAAFEQAQKTMWALDVQQKQLPLNESALAVGEFSPLEGREFYQLLEKVENRATETEIASIKEYLKQDAEQELMRKVLKRL